MNCHKQLDERIDSELLALAKQAKKMIPSLYGPKLSAEKDERGHPKDFSLLWTGYLSAAMYTNAEGVIALLVHDLGIQATALERQGYEVMKRLEFYTNDKEAARLEYLAWAWREKKLLDDMQFDITSTRYVQTVEAIEATKRHFPEVEAYALKNGCKERSFADMVGISGDPAAAKEYAFRYRVPSQTAHLSISGAEHFLRSDGTPGRVIINFGSSILDPNFGLQQVTMTVIRVLDILDQMLGANRWDEISVLDGRLNTVMSRLNPDHAHLLVRPHAPSTEGY